MSLFENSKFWNNIARLLVGIVLFLNIQCALLFIASPAYFAPGFELTGLPGEVMVQGMGILFLMWNVPYVFAFTNPQKRWISLLEAVLMQAVGLAGESALLFGLPDGHTALRMSGLRFVIFDGTGLVLLLVGFWISRKKA